MATSPALITMANDVQRLVSGFDVPATMTREKLRVTVTVSLDNDIAPGGVPADPQVVAFWGRLAVEVVKILAAGAAGAIGAAIGGSSGCETTETTMETTNPDGSVTKTTVKKTTCKP